MEVYLSSHAEQFHEGGMCLLTGKFRYDQKVDAEAKLAVFKAGHGDHRGKTPKRAYYCDLCGGWHLTAKSRWRQRKKKKMRNFVTDRLTLRTHLALTDIQKHMFIINMARSKNVTPAMMQRVRESLAEIKAAARSIELPDIPTQ